MIIIRPLGLPPQLLEDEERVRWTPCSGVKVVELVVVRGLFNQFKN